MPAFLTDEWFAAVHADGVALDDVTIDVTVLGAPGADVRCAVTVQNGTLSAAAAASGALGAPGAEVSLTLRYDDVVAVLHGTLSPSVTFMQGTMKTAGDPGRLLDVLAATERSGFGALRDELRAATEL